MTQRKQRNKMPPHEVQKVRAYYEKKFNEFQLLTAEELIELSKTKMSFTTKRALIHAFSLKEKKVIKEESKDGTDNE